MTGLIQRRSSRRCRLFVKQSKNASPPTPRHPDHGPREAAAPPPALGPGILCLVDFMNKYRRWYNQLIKRAHGRKLDCYSEKHHIKPRALGGGDKLNNLVRLTYREHFLAHWLLTKFTKGEERRAMLWALTQMGRRGRNKHGRIVSSIQYEALKLAYFEASIGKKLTEAAKEKIAQAQRGRLKPEWGAKLSIMLKGNKHLLGHRHSEETKQKMSLARIGNTNSLGYRWSEKQKLKASKSKLNNKNSVGRKLPPEHIAALRAGHKRYWDGQRGNK